METSVTLDLMYKMDSKIVIFEGNQNDGVFSIAKRFYEKGINKRERLKMLREARIRLGNKYGFDGCKIFRPEQKQEDSDIYEDNKCVILDKSYMRKRDYYNEVINTDILMISKDYPGIAVAHQMADCPVLIAEDRKLGVTALTHTSIYHVNRGLAKALIESLIKEYNSNPKDIYLYIGSHISKESYVYDKYPPQATNKEIWDGAIEEVDGKFYINLEQAILNQLKEFDLGGIEISKFDTATTNGYASHRKAQEGDSSKLGQNIVGFYYK